MIQSWQTMSCPVVLWTYSVIDFKKDMWESDLQSPYLTTQNVTRTNSLISTALLYTVSLEPIIPTRPVYIQGMNPALKPLIHTCQVKRVLALRQAPYNFP